MQDLAASGHTSVYFYGCDVTNYDDVLSMARKIHEQVGDVTILINNAGIAYINLLLDHKKSEIEKLMNINIMAQYWVSMYKKDFVNYIKNVIFRHFKLFCPQ